MDINKIFSREALNKLRSPEKLDTLLPITTPINWMALIAIGILLFSVVLWSIFGAFTVKVDGMGMIMDSAGIVNVSHISEGKIKQIYVHSGSKIKKGDLIARMEQPVQDADTRMAQYNIALSQSDRDAMSRASEHDAKKTQELVSEYIYSDYDGIVDEIMVETGSIINVGTPICSIRRTQNRDELSGVLYIPVEQGKRVETGMSIQLAPNGVDTSQSGWLLGVVRSVSQYPTSTTAMSKVLGNEQLVQYILNNEQLTVTFTTKGGNSDSGYLCSSFVGQHKPITAGSFCTGSIIIDRVPPIEKVFYKFSQWLRSR